MSNPTGNGGDGPLIPSRAIQFSENIDPPEPGVGFNSVTVEREMPYDGIVSQIYIDVPDGVYSRTGFNIRDQERGIRMFPFDEESEFAAFNDVQDFWPVTFAMRRNEIIEVNYQNRDTESDEPTLLKIWAIVVGEEALPADLEDYARRDGVTL